MLDECRRLGKETILESLRLIAEDDTGQMKIRVRRLHAPVPSPRHERDPVLPSRCPVCQACVAQVVEGADVGLFRHLLATRVGLRDAKG